MQLVKLRTVENAYQIRPSVRSVNQTFGSTSTITNVLTQLVRLRTAENANRILPIVIFVKMDLN